MNLSSLSLQELKAKHGRHITAAYKVWAEIQRREGMENIENMVSCLPKKQQTFLLALWKTPQKRMSILDLEKKVWKTKDHESVPQGTMAHLVWRLGNSLVENSIPLFIEEIKRENGDIVGYQIKRQK
jgi:hypothetical protein